MVDRGLVSEFERSLSSQEGPVWFPVGASLWAPKLRNEIVVAPAKTLNCKLAAAFDCPSVLGKAPGAPPSPFYPIFHFSFFYGKVLVLRIREKTYSQSRLTA